MRTTALCVAVAGAASVALAAGGPQKTADGINTRFTLDFQSEILAFRAVPEGSSIAGDFLDKEKHERPAVVFAVADEDAQAGFSIVFQGTMGRVFDGEENVGPLTPSTRGASRCDFLLGISEYELVGDVVFSDDGGIVAAEVVARPAHCRGAAQAEGVAVWTVVPTERGAEAINGVLLRDMETLDSVATLRADAGMPGNGAAIVVGRTDSGDPVSYVIERREEAAR